MEVVAPPTQEPRIAGDDGPSGAATNEVRVGGAMQHEGNDARRLPASRVRRRGAPGPGGRVAGGKRQDRRARGEVPAKHARRRQIFDVVEAPSPLFAVEESEIPLWIVAVGAVECASDDRGQAA